MKHMFLPLPIETVRKAWDEWRDSNSALDGEVRLLETKGGCVLVSSGRPPRVFVDLLKTFLSQTQTTVAPAA
jgi:hypothetical protein